MMQIDPQFITVENFEAMILNRDVRDKLENAKHPLRAMDESGFSYYDYAVYKSFYKSKNKRRETPKPPVHVLNEINTILQKGDVLPYLF